MADRAIEVWPSVVKCGIFGEFKQVQMPSD